MAKVSAIKPLSFSLFGSHRPKRLTAQLKKLTIVSNNMSFPNSLFEVNTQELTSTGLTKTIITARKFVKHLVKESNNKIYEKHRLLAAAMEHLEDCKMIVSSLLYFGTAESSPLLVKARAQMKGASERVAKIQEEIMSELLENRDEVVYYDEVITGWEVEEFYRDLEGRG